MLMDSLYIRRTPTLFGHVEPTSKAEGVCPRAWSSYDVDSAYFQVHVRWISFSPMSPRGLPFSAAEMVILSWLITIHAKLKLEAMQH